MKRLSPVIAALALAASACGAASVEVEATATPATTAPSATTTLPPTLPTEPPPPTTTAPAPVVGVETPPPTVPPSTAPPTTAPPTTVPPPTTAPPTTAAGPAIEQVRGSYPAGVVVVSWNDTLNVREGPGVDYAVIDELAPDGTTTATGRQARVGSATWHEVVVPAGVGWVHGRYLAEIVDDATFAADADAVALVRQLTDVMAARGDLSALTSSRGLYVSYHDAPLRFRPSEIPGLLTSSETRIWPSILDPEAAVPQTFGEAVAARFAVAYDDSQILVDEPWVTGNSRLPSDALPIELRNFHFFSVIETQQEFEWVSWHVSIDYRDGPPRIVGLTIDEWSP